MIKKRWIWLIGITLLFLSIAQPFASTYADAKTYDQVVLRGNAETLDWSSDDNPLSYNTEEGVWISKPIPLEGGKVTEFKFVYDGNWMPGANLTYTAPQDAEYIFAFHPENERKVDIRLADTYEASVELELTVPEGTPEWITPTVASSKNDFHYTAAPMTKTSEHTYTTKIVGQAGEEVSYFYSLAGKSYKEERSEPRTVTLSTSGDTKEDIVTKWKKVPVAHSVTHDYNHTPYVPDHRDDVTVKVEVQHFGPIDKGAIYYTTDGTTPDGKRGEAVDGQTVPLKVTDTSEDADGLKTSIMEGIIPPQKKETRVKYKLDVWNSNSDGSQFADNNVLNSEEANEFAYYVDTYESPKWAKEAVIYQVFVDRFRDGSTENNTSVKPEQPYDEQLKGWMGGDLQGVLEKMDYIENLGVNTLWISPIYEGPYSHGYHPTDFMNIDPRFGSNQLMKELVGEAHKRDMKVVYDLVPNHTSDQHDFFQDALEKGPESPYYDWYTFTNYPNEYDTFYGIQELPELNNDNPETRAYMLDEVVPFWMNEIGVDGFRLDYAKGPSQSFWVDFRHKVKSLDDDAFIFGEVWDNLDTISSYKGKLDGAIDFETHSAITTAFIKDGSVNALASSLEETFGTYGHEFVAATFLDSHDMPRFLFEEDGNEETLKNAAALQFTLPGAPIIYYGDEVGLSQSGDHNLVDEWKDRYYREMMIWEEEKQNKEILSHYKTLIDARNNQPALTNGDFNIIYSDDDVLVFERSVPQDKVLVVMNLGDEDRKLDIIDLYNQQTPNKVQLTSLLDKEKLKSHKGELKMTSEAGSVEIYDVKGKLRYEAPSEEKKYNKVVLRGSAPFDWSSDANMLTFDEKDALWKSEPIELIAGETVEYKFVRDGEWLEGDNLRFTPEAGGKYIFIFDPQNEYQVTVERIQAVNEAA